MRIISKKILREFWEKHPNSEKPLNEWYKGVNKSEWDIPQDILDQFPNARVIPNNRAVFNIKGNKYRLVVFILYKAKNVYIRFIGSHSEYDKINAEEV